MARREFDGKASKEVGGTQEDTDSVEEKAVPKHLKLVEMKTAQNPKMTSREPQKSKRDPKTKSAAKRTQRATTAQMKAKAKKPSQEVTENQSMKSSKNKNAKPGLKKPSMEKTETNSKRSARAPKKPSVGYGEEVTPQGLSGKDLKEAEKQMAPTYESSVMQQAGTPVSNKEFTGLQDQITHLPHFHGFICRDDLGVLLKKPGDWLIRVSVLSDETKKKDQVIGTKEKTVPKEKNQKFFVVSVYCKPKVDKLSPATPPYAKPPVSPSLRHLVIRDINGKVLVEMLKPFKSFAELIGFYSKYGGSYQGADFQLLTPVPLMPWEFQHEDVDLLEKKLGEGAFGDVRVGRLKTKDGRKTVEVAVKMLKNTEKAISREQVAELLHEARVMRVLEHPNVLRSYGIAVLKEPLYLMSELCTLGALREYLKENKSTITLLDKLNFVLGSARGVEYLHSQRLIHRDLAVRNILLTSDKTPKVSDFGLAKLTDRYEMREACKIPVRYLAPETLELFIFTSKTDVFSFGCVIWEIYENGQQPHDGKNAQTIRAQSKRREFLRLSPSAPDDLRRLVSERVFVSDPENRCSMAAIVQCSERLDKSTKK